MRLKVLVTGSSGYLGQRCHAVLVDSEPFDVPRGNVLSRRALQATTALACIHLAAHKYAITGEESPAAVAELNILGTRNVVERFGPDVVLASTCKAADAMTAYGASKLIAERIVLNAGGRVVRLVNVWGSTGSVADIWAQIPAHEPIPVADECWRMWMMPAEAVGLLTRALHWPSGRYAPIREAESMAQLAQRKYPDRAKVLITPRRGDRIVERLVGEYEQSYRWTGGVQRIVHPADSNAAVPKASPA